MEAEPNTWSVFNCVVLGLSVQIIKCFALPCLWKLDLLRFRTDLKIKHSTVVLYSVRRVAIGTGILS